MTFNSKKTVLKQIMMMPKTRFRPLSPAYIQNVFAQCIASHDVRASFKLIQVMCLNRRVSHEFIKKAFFILVSTKLETSLDQNLDYNIKQCIMDLLALETDQTETLLEYLLILIANQKWQDANQLSKRINSRIRSVSRIVFPLIDNMVNGSLALLDFISWLEDVQNNANSLEYVCFDEKIKTKANKVSFNLKNVIESSSDCFDVFLIKFIEINIFYENISEIKDVLSKYISLHPNHLNAYIYMYYFMTCYYQTDDENYDEDEYNTILNLCFKQIVKLSPSQPLIVKMSSQNFTNHVDSAEILIKFLDFVENKNDIAAWEELCSIFNKMNEDEKSQIVKIYETNHKSYWQEYHFNFDKELNNKSEAQLVIFKELAIAFLENMSDLSGVFQDYIRDTTFQIK